MAQQKSGKRSSKIHTVCVRARVRKPADQVALREYGYTNVWNPEACEYRAVGRGVTER